MKKTSFVILLSISGIVLAAAGVSIGLGISKALEAKRMDFSTERCHSYFEENDLFHDQAAEYISDYEPKADEEVTLRLKVRHGMAKEASILYTFDYNKSNPSYHESPMRFERVDDGLAYDYWVGAIPHNEAPYQYHFTVRNDVDSIYYNIDGIGEGEPATSSSDWSIRPGFFTPSWSQGALWYSIMPESFYNENTLNDKTGAKWDSVWGGHNSWAGEWFGGDLSGIQAKEDYLYNTLNVTSLFLNPIWVTAHNAGYGAYDFYQIDSSFGNDDDLLALVAALHEDEMKIMLDAVFEYCNVNNILNNISKLYPDLLGDLYYGFGQRDAGGNQIESPWGGVIVDFSHQIARTTIYSEEESVILSYLIYFGIDAWRMDVGNTLTGSDPKNWGDATQILADIRTYIKEVSENVLFLTEHADSNQLTDGIMDSKWNYAFNKAVLDWCQNNSNAKMLSTNLRNSMFYYPRGVTNSLYNFLTTHDQAYFYEEIGYDKTSYLSAEILLLTYLGSPCIYFGEEYGQKPHYYTDAKAMRNSFYTAMSWDEWNYDRDIYNFVRNLTFLRKEYKDVFTKGGLMNLYAESRGNDNDIYAYARFSDEVAITLLNRHSAFVKDFQLDVSRLGLKDGTILYDYLTNREFVVREGKLTLDIASYGSILVSRQSKRFVSDLEYEWKDEATSMAKVGESTYLLKGKSQQDFSNFAYANGFNNYAMRVSPKQIEGSIAGLIKDEIGEENYFGFRLAKNELTPIWRNGGSLGEGETKTISMDDEIRVAREGNDVCRLYVNDTAIVSMSIPFGERIRLGVNNLSGTNEISLTFHSLEKQLGSDFSSGVLGSWISPKKPVSFQDSKLVVNDNFLSAPCDMGDATFQAELSLPEGLSQQERAGIYFGTDENDYVFLGMNEGKLAFGHVVNGKIALYGSRLPESGNVHLQIEKCGTTYQGILLKGDAREVIGRANVNYSRLMAGLINTSAENMLVAKAGFGDCKTSLRDYSQLGAIDFSSGSYLESSLSMKYIVHSGSGFAYTRGGIAESNAAEDSVYGFYYALNSFTATFSLNLLEAGADGFVGVRFDADADYANGYLLKLTKEGALTLLSPEGNVIGQATLAKPEGLLQFHIRVIGQYIHIYGNGEDLLISSDARTPKSGKFAWVSHNHSYELRSYNIYKPTGNYISYQGDMYVKEKEGDVQIELASSSTTNYCGLRNEGQKYFNLGFNLQLERISPIRRGYFDFAFGASVGAYYLDGVVFRVDDLGRISLFEDGQPIFESRETQIDTISSVYLNFAYSGNHLIVRAINYGQAAYFTLLEHDCKHLHSGSFSFYSANAGCKLNHIKGFGIEEETDVTALPSFNAPVMEEPIPANADPVNQPMSENYHNGFDSNSALGGFDRYAGQVYIEDGLLVVNGYTTVNWDAGAAIAGGTFSNFELTCRMKIGDVAESGGFAAIEFHKSSAEVNHQGTALTVLMYPGGYLALFIGSGILTSHGIQGNVDADGFVVVTMRVQNGSLTFGGGAGSITVNLGSLSNNNNLTSGFISLNAGAAMGYFDYIDITLL